MIGVTHRRGNYQSESSVGAAGGSPVSAQRVLRHGRVWQIPNLTHLLIPKGDLSFDGSSARRHESNRTVDGVPDLVDPKGRLSCVDPQRSIPITEASRSASPSPHPSPLTSKGRLRTGWC